MNNKNPCRGLDGSPAEKTGDEVNFSKKHEAGKKSIIAGKRIMCGKPIGISRAKIFFNSNLLTQGVNHGRLKVERQGVR